jgi:hypothetical protein
MSLTLSSRKRSYAFFRAAFPGFPHRAAAALRARSVLCSGVMFAEDFLPPARAPRLPMCRITASIISGVTFIFFFAMLTQLSIS